MQKTLIFLHGWAACADVWQRQREYFREYKVFTPELYLDNLNALTKEIYRLCKDKENIVIVGWSMGWLVVLRLLEYAIRPCCLISIAGTPKFISEDYLGKNGIKKSEFRAFRLNLKKDFVRGINIFYNLHGIPQFSKQLLHKKDLVLRQLNILEKEDLRRNLALIKCPVLFIAGQKDKLCPPAIARYMARQVNCAQISIIKDAAHAPFWQRAKEVNLLMGNFIKESRNLKGK